MIVKDIARSLLEGPVALERLRRTNRRAMVGSGVHFAGDASRVHLELGMALAGAGRGDEAIAAVEHAARLLPTDLRSALRP